MNEGNRITDRPQLESIPAGSTYLVESGDGSGTKYIKHEDLVKKMNEDLSIGDMDDLKELDKLEDQANSEESGAKEKLTFVKAILKVLGIVTAVFKGTDGIKAGTAGMVPAPGPEDKGKVLGAEGKWVTAGTGGDVDAENVKFSDGMTAEDKIGMIEGATADLNCENENMVAMMSAVKQVNDSLNSLKNYSATERVVGTINGITIYEKSYYASNLNASSNVTIDSSLTSDDIKYVVSIEGAILFNNNTWAFQRQITNNGTMYNNEFVIAQNGLFMVVQNSPVNAYFVTVRYIKN